MRTIRDDIERDRLLVKYCRPTRVYKPAGLRCTEQATGEGITYCSACKGPVVDSKRAREIHAQNSMKCREAMGGESASE
jgi:hypothetical protein